VKLARVVPPPTGKEVRVTVKLRNNRMIEAREARGWSQAQAAEAAGTSAPSIGNLETFRASPLRDVYLSQGRPSGPRRPSAVVSTEWRKAALRIARCYGMPPEHFWPESVLAIAGPEDRVMSTDALALSLGSVPLRAIEASSTEHPEDVLNSKEEGVQLARWMGVLKPMEARILRWRFGLDGEEELTLDEIGAKYNLSRERTRQIQQGALRKMRLAADVAPVPLEPSQMHRTHKWSDACSGVATSAYCLWCGSSPLRSTSAEGCTRAQPLAASSPLAPCVRCHRMTAHLSQACSQVCEVAAAARGRNDSRKHQR